LRLVERGAIVLASLALSALLIALLSGFFAGRDAGTVAGSSAITGERFHDMGDALLRPGQRPPRYDSAPPTSGPHLPEQVRQDKVQLNDNELLEALASGDVVILYGGPTPPPGLSALAASLAPPFTLALASTGDAVILARRPGTGGLIGLAWAHMIRVGQAKDPRLREFAAFWLGRGAGAKAP
jgi:Protein of unknown function (DUF3105)